MISLVGSQLTAVGLPWFVLETSGSAARTGLVAFAGSVAFLLSGIFSGPLVDRHGYKQISVLSDLVAGVAVGLVPLFHVTVGLPFWLLLALVFAANLFQSPGQSARARVLPELGRLAGFRLERVNATSESIYQVSLLLGPPLAGGLIVLFGPSEVLLVDAATFFVSAGLIATLLPPDLAPKRTTRGRYRDELAEGVRFLRQERLLLPLTLSSALGILLVNAPLFAVVLPVYANRTFGSATDLGLLFSSFAVGALAGAGAFAALGDRLSRRWLWVARFALVAAPYWALAFDPSLPIALLAIALCGLANGTTNPLLVTVRYQRTPLALRGRVSGPLRMIGGLAAPLGVLLAGAAIEAVGLRTTVLVAAAGTIAVGLGVLIVPTFRLLDTPPSDVGLVEAGRAGSEPASR